MRPEWRGLPFANSAIELNHYTLTTELLQAQPRELREPLGSCVPAV
jgi:hypothetical protein